MGVGILTAFLEEDERSVVLSRSRIHIGRSSQCEVLLNHQSVSRHHAEIEHRDDGYLLMDVDSRNGTRVNGVAVMRRLLHDGDRIAFGDIEAVFHEIEKDDLQTAGAVLDEDAGEEEGPLSGATIAAPMPDAWHAEKWDMVQAWQIVKRFGESRSGDVEAVLHLVAQELSGLRDVRQSLVYVAPAVLGNSAKWFGASAGTAKCMRMFAEEKLLAVVQGGKPLSLHAGRYSEGLTAQGADAVCLPIRVSDRSCACLYMEGDGELSKATVNAAEASAQGISVGLSIWLHACKEKPGAGAPIDSPVIVGRSKPIQQAFHLAGKAAATDSTVLIRGETGTGKELFARLIWMESKRKKTPFIPVHCSAVEETLMGSVLFGHEKGAFTGAVGQKKGIFEEAHDGTIFLDEVGELTLPMQVKLLRVLQEGEFMRIGGNKTLRVNVRILAATNRDLESAIAQKLFREDLYYRLNVVVMKLPPLRERSDDIPDMVRHFLHELGANTAKTINAIDPAAMAILQRYDWPGNVRELRNIIERALVLAEGSSLTVDDLPAEMVLAGDARSPAAPDSGSKNLADVEHRHIAAVMQHCGGNKRLAAQRLGISRSTLYEKIRGMVQTPAING